MLEYILAIIVAILVCVIIYLLKFRKPVDADYLRIEMKKEIAETKANFEEKKAIIERQVRTEFFEKEEKLRIAMESAFEKSSGLEKEIIEIRSEMTTWKAQEEEKMHGRIRDARDDALKRSRVVLKGKIGEQLAPIFDVFPFDVADARFIGSPVDFLVFDGYSDGEIKEVVLVEIKTGKSRLSTKERSIRNVVNEGRFRWLTVNIDKALSYTSEALEDKFDEDDE